MFTAEGTETAEVFNFKTNSFPGHITTGAGDGRLAAFKTKAGTIGFSILRGFLRALSGLCGETF